MYVFIFQVRAIQDSIWSERQHKIINSVLTDSIFPPNFSQHVFLQKMWQIPILSVNIF